MGARQSASLLEKKGAPAQIVAPKRAVWVYCEGATEPHWLQHLRHPASKHGLQVNPIRQCGVPKTVVDQAVKKRKEISRAKRSYFGADEVWSIIDRDSHPGVKEAIAKCQDEGIGLVFSNECFELWPLLFITEIHSYVGRHDLQARLHEFHPHYHHDKNPYILWDQLGGSVEEATRRAIQLHRVCARRIAECGEDPFRTPFTTAWILYDRLMRGDNFVPWMADTLRPHAELHDLTSYLPVPLRDKVIRRLL